MNLISPADLLSREPEAPNWLIPDFIVKGTLVAIAGDPGIGKSYLGYLLALSLATGAQFLGKATFPTRVLYFDQENSLPDMRQYLHQLWGGLDTSKAKALDNMRIGHFSLGYPGWHTLLRNICQEWEPKCVIFDTANTVFNIQDESDNAEATKVINNLRTTMAALGPETVFIVLRHAKLHTDHTLPNKRTMRGAKVWHSMVDQVDFLIQTGGRPNEETRRGLRPTRLVPDKTRAFGLKDSVIITPEWINPEAPEERRIVKFSASWALGNPPVNHTPPLREEEQFSGGFRKTPHSNVTENDQGGRRESWVDRLSRPAEEEGEGV